MEDANTKLQAAIKDEVENHLVPALKKFIETPNLSRAFDKDYATNGHMEAAAQLCVDYANSRDVKGLKLEVAKDEGKTLLVFGEVEATKPDAQTIFVYGHIDKQPHLTDLWSEGLHPTKAVMRGSKLYGRGSNDDGYAFFLGVSLVKALQRENVPHDRYVFFVESDEESSSKDIPYYLDKFADRIGQPDMIFCLDSASISRDIFCLTSSLRGCINLSLKVETMPSSCHSGLGSGEVADTFRIVRALLERLEDMKTGTLIPELYVDIPADKYQLCEDVNAYIDESGLDMSLARLEGVLPVGSSNFERLLNTWWRPTLCITGQEGLPNMEGGNVLRKETTFKLSVRIPPLVDGKEAAQAIIKTLTTDVPYNAKVTAATMEDPGNGWNAPRLPENVMATLHESARAVFGKKVYGVGCGGSIPFVELLANRFPKSLFFVTGVATTDGNAHCPDEWIDVEYLAKFSQALSLFLKNK